MIPPLVASNPRAAALAELIELMPRLITPGLDPVTPPDPAQLQDPAALAQAAASSAEIIARAVAALGEPGDDAKRAKAIWDETLAQIARIQKLYRLPALPFQPTGGSDSAAAAPQAPAPCPQ